MGCFSCRASRQILIDVEALCSSNLKVKAVYFQWKPTLEIENISILVKYSQQARTQQMTIILFYHEAFVRCGPTAT